MGSKSGGLYRNHEECRGAMIDGLEGGGSRDGTRIR